MTKRVRSGVQRRESREKAAAHGNLHAPPESMLQKVRCAGADAAAADAAAVAAAAAAVAAAALSNNKHKCK